MYHNLQCAFFGYRGMYHSSTQFFAFGPTFLQNKSCNPFIIPSKYYAASYLVISFVTNEKSHQSSLEAMSSWYSIHILLSNIERTNTINKKVEFKLMSKSSNRGG